MLTTGNTKKKIRENKPEKTLVTDRFIYQGEYKKIYQKSTERITRKNTRKYTITGRTAF